MNCCSVDSGLLVLKEVVTSSVDNGMLVMRNGVEPSRSVVGFKSTVVMNAVVAKAVDHSNVVVD